MLLHIWWQRWRKEESLRPACGAVNHSKKILISLGRSQGTNQADMYIHGKNGVEGFLRQLVVETMAVDLPRPTSRTPCPFRYVFGQAPLVKKGRD
jgi:hypothetical protein